MITKLTGHTRTSPLATVLLSRFEKENSPCIELRSSLKESDIFSCDENRRKDVGHIQDPVVDDIHPL